MFPNTNARSSRPAAGFFSRLENQLVGMMGSNDAVDDDGADGVSVGCSMMLMVLSIASLSIFCRWRGGINEYYAIDML